MLDRSFIKHWLILFVVVLFLFGSGRLLIDEEFFIVVAFLTFLLLVTSQIGGLLGDSLDARIVQFQTGLLRSREVMLRLLTQLYQFQQNLLRVIPMQNVLRAAVLESAVPAVLARSVDREFLDLHHGFQLLRSAQSLEELAARNVSLQAFFDLYGTIRERELLAPFADREDFEVLAAAESSTKGLSEAHLSELLEAALISIELAADEADYDIR